MLMFSSEIIVALIYASATGMVGLINSRALYNKTTALFDYKLTELTERVDKHNNVVERTYALEEESALHDEKIKVINHRLDDLEENEKAYRTASV